MDRRWAEGAVEQPEDATDDDLIRRCQTGDTAAFGRLVTRYMRRAYFAALALVGNPDDALDLSQQAFARAYRARQTIDPARPWYPWLYQIVRRLCFNFTRDERTRRERITAAGPWLVGRAAAHAERDRPDASLERREQQERVREAIDRLPMEDREVLVLKEFEQLKYREIAELLDIPMGTVMSRLYAARRRLAEHLEGPP